MYPAFYREKFHKANSRNMRMTILNSELFDRCRGISRRGTMRASWECIPRFTGRNITHNKKVRISLYVIGALRNKTHDCL